MLIMKAKVVSLSYFHDAISIHQVHKYILAAVYYTIITTIKKKVREKFKLCIFKLRYLVFDSFIWINLLDYISSKYQKGKFFF